MIEGVEGIQTVGIVNALKTGEFSLLESIHISDFSGILKTYHLCMYLCIYVYMYMSRVHGESEAFFLTYFFTARSQLIIMI